MKTTMLQLKVGLFSVRLYEDFLVVENNDYTIFYFSDGQIRVRNKETGKLIVSLK